MLLMACFSLFLDVSGGVSLGCVRQAGNTCLADWPQSFSSPGLRCLSLPSVWLFSRKVCSAILEFWHAQDGGDYDDGVDHREDQARVYASVPEALPREPAVSQVGFHSPVQAFRLRP